MESSRHAPFRHVRRVPSSTLAHLSPAPLSPGQSVFSNPVQTLAYPPAAFGFPTQRGFVGCLQSLLGDGRDRIAARAALGFGGNSSGFPAGLSPTPITHVSASPPFHPGQLAFPNPVGDLDFPQRAFPMPWRLKCQLTYTPYEIGLPFSSTQIPGPAD